MVVGFTPTYAISCEVEYLLLDTILGDKVCRRLAAGWWFSANAPPIKKSDIKHQNVKNKNNFF
jgi:hypothetical protein